MEKYKNQKILVRGRAGKAKAFLYSSYNRDLLQGMQKEFSIHNKGNLPHDGYYIAKVADVFVDRKGQKRVYLDKLKFLSDSSYGLEEIEPYLYYSYQVQNVLERKVKTDSKIVILMALLETSIRRPIIVVPQSFKTFTRIVKNYNSKDWGDMWENIFNLQVLNHTTTRYNYIVDLQVRLLDEYNDLEFDYARFVEDILEDIMPTERGLKELDKVINSILYTNGEEDLDSIEDGLSEYLW